MHHLLKLLIAYSLGGTLLATLVINLQAADPAAVLPMQTDLRLNEFMAANSRSLEDPDQTNSFPDWLELYNAGAAAASLDGLFLTNDPANPTLFPIPSGLSIPAGGFLVFYADDDPNQGPLHATFTLSRDGGFIGLYDSATQTMIDSHNYLRQSTDVSEGRDVDGSGAWRSFIQVTPGASNMLLPPLIRSVELSPTQPQASTTPLITAIITDDSSSVAVSLFYSSTGETGFTAVPMTSVPSQSETYEGQIPARPDGTVVRYYVAAADSDGLTSLNPVNAPARTFVYVVGFVAPVLYINEFMAENQSVLENPDLPGNFPDWIEIYNPGSTPVSLDGLFLTDSPGRPTLSPIPGGLVVPAGGHLLFYADNRPHLGALHLDFSLSPDGEDIHLYGAEGTVLVDGFRYEEQLADVSQARIPDGGVAWDVTHCPTPGASNTFCGEVSLPVIHR